MRFSVLRRRHNSVLSYGHVQCHPLILMIPSASHSILRPVTTALRSNSTGLCLRYALHNNSFLLRSRSYALPVHKFHATSFPSATHRTTPHTHRDWRPPGRFRRFITRFNHIPQNFILLGILGINGVVFAAWSYVQMFHVRLFHRPVFATHSVLCYAEHVI